MATYLPLPKEVRDLLTDLMGREITLNPSAPFAPAPAEPATIAVYVDDQLQISGVIVCDLAFSAYAGAAIGLVPPAGAETAIEEQELTETLADNLYEVLNIAASLFNAPDHDHLKLHAVRPATRGGMDLNDRFLALTLGRREDWSIDIAGYGHGLITIILTR
jgi:hypothetical protein